MKHARPMPFANSLLIFFIWLCEESLAGSEPSMKTHYFVTSNSGTTEIKAANRVKRSLEVGTDHFKVTYKNDPKKKGWTNQEKAMLLSKHNELRAQVTPNATDMLFMTWDDELESMAQEWTDRCIWEHGTPPRNPKPYSFIGQNIGSTTAGYSVDGCIHGWFREVQFYHYEEDDCDMEKQCGHYTQFVWAKSHRLGCGITFCPQLLNLFPNGTFAVCNYGPGGNYANQRPYTSGDSCTNCPSDMNTCEGTLCRESPPCRGLSCHGKGTMDTRTCICKCDTGSGAFCDKPGSDTSAYTNIRKYEEKDGVKINEADLSVLAIL